MKETKGTRLHIGFFGKRNAGKSTIVNKIIGQDLSIVSDIKGTTTDVNEKAMELLPIGPVVLMDTAGIDDEGEIGSLRVQKTYKALNRADVAVFVADYEKLSDIEKKFLLDLKNKDIPILSIINKTDKALIDSKDADFITKNSSAVIYSDIKKPLTKEFKETLFAVLNKDNGEEKKLFDGIIEKNDVAVLVIPIDKEAPKGRIILPQVNAIRDMLDKKAISVICDENNLSYTISLLKNKPRLVVTDSQAFKKVSEIIPEDIMLTSFSILFARLKGDIKVFYEGAKKADNLSDGDKILILESCSHHPVEDDIGTVKIPNLLKKYTGKNLIFEHYSGHDFPKSLGEYSLIIHCGACMTNAKEVMNRIKTAKENNTAITNYGIIIAKCLGILERAIKPLN